MVTGNKIPCFHGDDVAPCPPEDALFHVIPVPLEKSVSYGGGTARGPAAILDASVQLETLTLGTVPAENGIYTAAAVNCAGHIGDVLARVGEHVEYALNFDALPVLLGGEHTLSMAVIAPLKKKYGNFGVVQFDAHADLRKEYGGTAFSHAAVMRRFHEQKVPLLQIGTRSYSLEEKDYRLQNKGTIHWLDADRLAQEEQWEVVFPADFPENIYLSLDVDGLDASVMPATGTPVPGGLSWYQAMWLLKSVLSQRRCIGFDVVEFTPLPGQNAWDFTAAQLVYNIMAYCSQ